MLPSRSPTVLQPDARIPFAAAQEICLGWLCSSVALFARSVLARNVSLATGMGAGTQVRYALDK
jgi:hypothetical protein